MQIGHRRSDENSPFQLLLGPVLCHKKVANGVSSGNANREEKEKLSAVQVSLQWSLGWVVSQHDGQGGISDCKIQVNAG